MYACTHTDRQRGTHTRLRACVTMLKHRHKGHVSMRTHAVLHRHMQVNTHTNSKLVVTGASLGRSHT